MTTQTDERLDTGTTVVGIVADGDSEASNSSEADGPAVVLATDRRASLGDMVSSKSAQKIEPLADHAAFGYSGSVSGADALTRQLRAEISLFQTRRDRRISPKALASLVGNTLRESPVGVMPVVAAVDDDAHLFSYDAAGGRSDGEYAAVGSGTPYAYGHLETAYEEGLSIEEATGVAIDAVAVASERDLASGNGVNVGVVRADGVDIESHETVARAG